MSAARPWFRRPSTLLAGSACALAAAPADRFGGDLQPLEIVAIAVFVVLSLSLHEAAHAWTAWKLGDPTAKDLGRVTLNPLPSIDPFMTVILPIGMLLLGGFVFGGAKPVPVSYHRLRHPLRDMMLVALAGPLTNFVLAAVFLLGIKATDQFGDYTRADPLMRVLEYAMTTNLVLAAFNMLPIPPLDGSRVMAWLLPSNLREPYVQLERFGLLLVIGVVFFVPGTQRLVESGVGSMFSAIHFLTGGTW